ncbi:MAG: pilus assembly protein PilB [Planctomycetes bacterium HGW-Planctomycetes-1]|nr:MAG: pilus assembly protein PilB [Planctomycetes bacterium HGW-Planctomycetes-1]
MAKNRRKLGEILYKSQLIGKEALIDAIKTSQQNNKRLGETLIELGLVSEDNICKAIAHQFGLPYVDLDKHSIPQETMKLVPEEIVQKYNVLPLGKENGRLKLLISDPLDLDMLDTLRFRLSSELDCSIASPTKIRAFINRSLDHVRTSIDATAAELAEEGHSLEEEIRRAEEAEEDDEGPVIRLVNMIIDEAFRMRASDIHIEPMTDRVRVRYRVDGVCSQRDNIPKHMQASVLARLKILSGMDITERRLPQDGRIQREIDGKKIDFRVSALPGYHGESTVLRILSPESINIGIQALGLGDEDHQKFLKIIKRPNGIFLVTGPTGSGKSTTLYSALKELNKPDKKIITAEDPVEYNVAGINQCQVKEEIGLTFARILRSMLRQAPNVILVGEIRDGEVADIAIQAALTGHLVFSTLHTNDASSAITRLIDMGVKPFLVASSIQAIMAQRLVRRVCPACKIVDEHPDPHYLRLLNISPDDLKNHPVYKGTGCNKCNNFGYRGRQGIFEILEMNTELRELAFARAPATELRKAAKAGGMRTLLEDGREKVFKGITTPEEVSKHSQAEGLVLD